MEGALGATFFIGGRRPRRTAPALTGEKQATCVVKNNKHPRYSKFNKSRKLASYTHVCEVNAWLKKYCTGRAMTYTVIWARPQNWQTNLRQDSTANYIYILLQKAKMSKYDNKTVKKTLKLYTIFRFFFNRPIFCGVRLLLARR